MHSEKKTMYLFLCIGIFSAQVSLARVGMATCTKAGCPEGYFCHENTCKKCLKCDLLFRKGNFCVTDFNDCEDCLEGYEQVLVTDYSRVIKPCKPIKKKTKLKTCENDSSCPQDNYCNEDSCVKCFDCSLLNRVPPVDKCAKGLNECGSCMVGFNEVSVTTEVNHKPCEKNILIVPEVPVLTSFASIASGCALFFASLVLIMIFLLNKLKDRIPTKDVNQRAMEVINQRPVSPSAPPLYSMNTPQYVRKNNEIPPTFIGYVEEKTQQAKVFRQPNASYYYVKEEAENEVDSAPPENNGGTTPRSYTSANSTASEEINCSSSMLGTEHSAVELNDLRLDSINEQANVNTTDEHDSQSLHTITLNVISSTQILENSSDEETDNLVGTQTINQEQN